MCVCMCVRMYVREEHVRQDRWIQEVAYTHSIPIHSLIYIHTYMHGYKGVEELARGIGWPKGNT
jgi:hypothetical protein